MKDFIKKLEAIMGEYPQLKFEFRHQTWRTAFLRFFRSMTNYNISKEITSTSCTIHKGKRSYSFSVDDPTFDRIKKNIDISLKIIDALPEDPDFVDIEDDKRMAPEMPVVNNIEKLSLDTKIDILRHLSNKTGEKGFKIFGTFITNFVEGFILNSNGVKKYFHSSPVMIDVKAVSDKNMVTVLESWGSSDPDRFDLDDFTSSLMRKVEMASLPIVDAEAGKYEVILSPSAIGEFLGYFMFGANAASLDRGSSYFQDKKGEKLFSENISIVDMPHHPELIFTMYNGDGRMVSDLPVIEKGVFKNFFVDNYYGNKLKMEKNGNGAGNLVMKKGEKGLEEMISSVKNGLYISKLHYMNFINPKDMTVTGLTRDGTFLIKDGKIVNVVNNLRYTEAIGRIVESIEMIEDKSYALPASSNYGQFSINSALMPHVKVSDFNITSSTRTI